MISERNSIALYRFANEYLVSLLPSGFNERDLKLYLDGAKPNLNSLVEVFRIFIASAQEYQQMPNVIQFIRRSTEIKEILHNYDYHYISGVNAEKLYYQFRDTFDVRSNDSKRNSWYKWSCSIVDSARFIDQFSDYSDFAGYVNAFRYNSSTRLGLPLVISTKIRGVGFALACNTLKELGFLDYPKPDVHLMDICYELNLCERNQYEVFETIVKIAVDNNVTPYEVDKMFWLICSGRLYLHNLFIGRHKDSFIAQAKIIME